ncbi:MAG TPA: ferredoxin, partial [Solibacterales bacterium]|nr:ferredoxin [Bryobacterales bacterium]
CGACTVIINNKVAYSCTVLAIDAQGKDIQTIEGLAPEGKLHPVSAAFVEHDGQQCGYCTPGFVMAAKGFLDKHPNPTEADVERGLGGNLCRCGTYVGVRKAVLAAAKNMKGARHA